MIGVSSDAAAPGGSAVRRMSLRLRVTLLATACVGIAVALVSIAGYLTVRTSLYAGVDDDLMQRTVALRAVQLQAVSFGEAYNAVAGAADIRIGILDEDTDQAYVAGGDVRLGAAELAVARGESDRSLRTDTVNDLRVAAVPAAQPGIALIVAQPLAGTRETLSRLGVVFGLVGGAGVLLAAVAGTAVAQAGLRPVQRLTVAAERVARTGDLTPIAVSGDDELARLTQSVNTMLGALAESRERQRRLVADAGHELRTPLTSLRTNVELLAAAGVPGAPGLPDQDRRDIHDDVRAQVEELTQLVGDLVELAREDAPQTVQEPVDLVEVVERALARARRRAPAVHFDVELMAWSLLGDAMALERAVLNLLDNAAKWSPDNGVVRVRMTPGRATMSVVVADEGPGISDADLPYVFDRFYRAATARTRPGSGLGLAIVAQAAARHGGSVQAARDAGGGAVLTLELPGRPPEL